MIGSVAGTSMNAALAASARTAAVPSSGALPKASAVIDLSPEARQAATAPGSNERQAAIVLLAQSFQQDLIGQVVAGQNLNVLA